MSKNKSDKAFSESSVVKWSLLFVVHYTFLEIVIFNDRLTDFVSMLSSGHVRKMCEKTTKRYMLIFNF